MGSEMQTVKYINPGQEYLENKKEFDAAFSRVMGSGSFILRDDVSRFEEAICEKIGADYAIGVNSGTDALFYSLGALGLKKDDEVITVAHTFVATISAIKHMGARPVLVDIKDDFNIDPYKVESRISEKTKVLLPVHMNGRSCNMDVIISVAEKHGLKVVEDAAQAFGAQYKGRYVGTFGDCGCFSAHPMKILSCPGDGGYITTNDRLLEEKIRLLRNHGQKSKTELVEYGFSSRLDNLHAAILNVKLKTVDEQICRRREIAEKYHRGLHDLPIKLPMPPEKEIYYDVYNSYVIKVDTHIRDDLLRYLSAAGIEVFAHMAVPLYKNHALGLSGDGLEQNEAISRRILSLPICPQTTDENVAYLLSSVRSFFDQLY